MRAQRRRSHRVPAEMRALVLTLVTASASAASRWRRKARTPSPTATTRVRSVDIASARAAHDRSNDRLAHIVRFHEPISPRNFRNAVAEHGPPGSVCVNIWTTRTPREASPNFDVCVTGDRDSSDLLASVSRLAPRGGVRRIGARFRRADEPAAARRAVRPGPDPPSRPPTAGPCR